MIRRLWIRKTLMLGVTAVLISSGLIALPAMAWPETQEVQRLRAQHLWERRPFSDYQVRVRVQRLKQSCIQEVQVRGDRVMTLENNCQLSWLDDLSVEQLFELGLRLEQSSECYLSADCSCQRLRTGSVVYDEQLGFPRQIAIERVVQPHLLHVDYWRSLWRNKALPNCGPLRQTFTATVLSLTPLTNLNP